MTQDAATEAVARWWTVRFQLGTYFTDEITDAFYNTIQDYVRRLLKANSKCYDPVLGYVLGCQIYLEESDPDLDAIWELIEPRITSLKHGPKYAGTRMTFQGEVGWLVRVKRGREANWELYK